MKNLTRFAVLASLFALPALASAQHTIVVHTTHAPVVRDRGPQPHFRTVEAHR